MELIDREKLLKELKISADHHEENSRDYVLMLRDRNIVREQPTVEAIPKDQYEARLKAERKKIAEDVADEMDYMHTCLNERKVILGIITGKRERFDSLCSTCKSEFCVCNGTAIPKANYENRLKADMVAMLEELKSEFEENVLADDPNTLLPFLQARETCIAIIQQKINSLKAESES